MSVNEYIQPTANTIKFDIAGIVTPGNVGLVTTQNNAYGTPYLSSSMQGTFGGSVFNVYLCLSTGVSLVVSRYVLSLAYTSTETFAAETAGQPNWHSFQVSPFDQIQLMTSGSATINKLVVMEPKPVT